MAMAPSGPAMGASQGVFVGAKARRRRILLNGFRLRFAFRGIPPGCFAKSAQIIENGRVAEEHFSRVWKLLKKSGLRVVVIRRDSSLGGVERSAAFKFGR